MADSRVREVEKSLTSIRTWSDDPEPDDHGYYPWPDDHTEFAVPDSLRDAVRARIGRTDGEVRLLETVTYGGYSEYTQEHYFAAAVTVDGAEVFSAESEYESENNLVALLKWLDEVAS